MKPNGCAEIRCRDAWSRKRQDYNHVPQLNTVNGRSPVPEPLVEMTRRWSLSRVRPGRCHSPSHGRQEASKPFGEQMPSNLPKKRKSERVCGRLRPQTARVAPCEPGGVNAKTGTVVTPPPPAGSRANAEAPSVVARCRRTVDIYRN